MSEGDFVLQYFGGHFVQGGFCPGGGDFVQRGLCPGFPSTTSDPPFCAARYVPVTGDHPGAIKA